MQAAISCFASLYLTVVLNIGIFS